MNQAISWAMRHRYDLLIMLCLLLLNIPLLAELPYAVHFDLTVYLSVARNLANGKGLTLPSGYPYVTLHPPLFPLLLSVFLKLTQGSVLYTSWLVKIFAVPTIWIIYFLGKNIFGRGAGLLAAVLATFLVVFRYSYSDARIDTVKDFLLFAGLLFMWMPYKRKGIWLLGSGVCLGLGFLQKEVILLWTPVPWILFFMDWRYRRNLHLRDLWAYTILVGIPVAAWMSWTYHWAGAMQPLSANATRLALQWGGVLIIAAFVGSLAFYVVEKRIEWFRSLVRKKAWTTIWMIVLVATAAFLSPLLTLFRGAWQEASLPWMEIPTYLTDRSLHFPVIGLVIAACAFLLISALWHGNQTSVFGTVTLVMGFPLLSAVAHEQFGPRQILGLVLICYLVFAGVVYWAGKWLHCKSNKLAYWIWIPAVSVFVLWFIFDQNAALARVEESMPTQQSVTSAGWADNNRLDLTAKRINRVAPTGSHMMASHWIAYALAYQLEGSYPVFALPMLKLQFDSQQVQQPFSAGHYTLRSYHTENLEREVVPEELIYLDFSIPAKSYIGIQETDVLSWIRDNQIDYLVLVSGRAVESACYMDYFLQNPAFKILWQGQDGAQNPVYLFRVQRTKMQVQGQFPLIVSPDTVTRLEDDSGGTWSIEQLADYSAREIKLCPQTDIGNDLTAKLARHYLENDEFTPAYTLYQQIQTDLPIYLQQELSDRVQEPADTLVHCTMYLVAGNLAEAETACLHAAELMPESNAPYAALGELAIREDDFEQAIFYFRHSTQLEPKATGYISLGDAYRLGGDFAAAAQAYNKATRLEPNNRLGQMHVWETKALQAQFGGNLEEALQAYQQAIDLYPAYFPTTLTWKEPTLRDSNQTVIESLAERASASQNIFIINRRPMRVLQSEKIVYQTTVPESTELAFSLGMSPEVWHLGKGDGTQFDIYMDDGNTHWHLFSSYIDPKNIPADRRWHDYKIDLSSWAGQAVTLTMTIGPGPSGDELHDWAGWGEPNIVVSPSQHN